MDDQQIIQFEPMAPDRNNTNNNQFNGGRQTISSLEIAEITGKPHNDVLKAIRAMEPAWEKITQGNFSLSTYKDPTGRTLPCYALTKTECLYIATKFNDEARAKLVLRWEQLEQQRFSNLPDFSNPAAAARAWAEQYERSEQLAAQNHQQTLLIEQKDKEIEEFKSKYSDLISQLKVKDDEIKILKDADEFGKNYIEADGTMTFDVACQYIGFGSHLKMRRWLESGDGHPKVVRILRYVNGKPEYGTYSPFTEKGWFKLKPNVILVKGEPKQAPGTLRITTLGVAGVKIMYERWKKRLQKENDGK